MTPIWRRKRRCRRGAPVLFVAMDDVQADAAAQAIRFFAPQLAVLPFPAWDCLPYDRVSPKPDIESRRLATLGGAGARCSQTSHASDRHHHQCAVAACAAERCDRACQLCGEEWRGGGPRGAGRVSSRAMAMSAPARCANPATSRLRGGIVDLWPPSFSTKKGEEQPLRLDFFGSTLDAMRRFDAETQLSDKAAVSEITLLPASEAPLNAHAISRFRAGYVASFGAAGDDPLYESVSAGRKAQGMEHWLPLFYERLDTLFDYLPRALVLLGHQAEEAKNARLELIADYYDTREQFRHAEG